MHNEPKSVINKINKKWMLRFLPPIMLLFNFRIMAQLAVRCDNVHFIGIRLSSSHFPQKNKCFPSKCTKIITKRKKKSTLSAFCLHLCTPNHICIYCSRTKESLELEWREMVILDPACFLWFAEMKCLSKLWRYILGKLCQKL